MARLLRQHLADVATLTSDLVTAAAPLLTGLRTGHDVISLVDLDLEYVTDATRSWWWRRFDQRGDHDDTPANQWPGTPHFQLRTPMPGPQSAYGVVLPTRPLDTASGETVAKHAEVIKTDARPAAVLLGWVEDRYVHAEHPERFLVGVVLDGHHKLRAYAEQQVPARALVLCRIDDSWGPPDDRAQWINETLRPFHVAAGAGPQ